MREATVETRFSPAREAAAIAAARPHMKRFNQIAADSRRAALIDQAVKSVIPNKDFRDRWGLFAEFLANNWATAIRAEFRRLSAQ